MKNNLIILFWCCVCCIAKAQDPNTELAPKRSYATKAIQDAPTIDGQINEPIWDQVEWGDNFTQREPEYGIPPTLQTAFKILYDAKNLYVAVRCFDTEPQKIEKRMSRRDGFEGDWVEINIDSYHDLRTAFSFTISAAGVKGDELISNNGNNWDGSWNPIWYTATNIDDKGWTAEMRIPLSQLRFPTADEQTWGIQFNRRDFRHAERSNWQPIPQNAGVWVSAFGELTGLKNLKSQKLLEIQPYVVGQVESYPKEEGNPFADGFDTKFAAGLDGKLGVTSDLVLDFTINPDFGQVEADPSAVNLDGYQIFFQERRPFFIENRNIFEYQITGSEAGGGYDSDQLFYSRRIGGQPRGRVSSGNNIYTDYPQNTRILGAAKFSGKLKNGLSIGVLEAVTAQESAEQKIAGADSKTVVEPLTSYFVGRLQQDFNGGNTVIGGVLTATNRRLANTGMDWMTKSAYTGGLDFVHKWDNQRWQVEGKAIFSNLNGTTEAITNVQTNFEHAFDRPDADHLAVDTSLTTLTGTGGSLMLAKYGGQWKFQTGVTYRSPNLEMNDIGFMNNTDEINQFFWGGYRTPKPFSIFRMIGVNVNFWNRWDFGGKYLHNAYNTNFWMSFKNFWSFNSGINVEVRDISNRALFGGPALRRPAGTYNWFNLGTDSRKKISANLNFSHGWAKNKELRVRNFGLWLRYQPINVLNISVSPGYNHFRRKDQFVTVQNVNGKDEYLVGDLDRKTISATIRINYSITPNLSFQYYGQPFTFQAEYDNFKRITDPLGKTVEDRTLVYDDNQVTYNDDLGEYYIDENNDGAADYIFGKPDFSFIQFNSNLVMRWEYTPGSELFLVWSQGNTNFGDPSRPVWDNFTDNIFGGNGNNIFLVKYTYRFLR